MRCFICGEPAQIGRFCKRCFRNEHPPVKHFAPLIIKVCTVCPAIKLSGGWGYEPTPDTIPSIIRKKVVVNEEYAVKAITVKPVTDAELGFHPAAYDVRLIVKKGSHEFEEFYQIPVQFQKEKCDRCLKSSTSYFEAILQLRSPTALVEEFIAERLAEARKRGVTLVKREQVREGYDYYLTSNKTALQIGRKLEAQFGGHMETSRTLHTRKKGKDLYRVTVLYRPPPVYKDEYLLVHNHVVQVVTTLDGIKLKDLRTGKIVKVTRIGSFRRLVPLPTTIAKTRPQIEALHPLTFQPVPVINATSKKAGAKVHVVFGDYDGVFVVS